MASSDAPDRFAILGLGMVTPLGHGAEASCAAIRAGLARFAEMPDVVVDDLPVVGARATSITEGLTGAARFTRLACGAVTDLVESTSLSPQDLASAGFYVALPPFADRPGLEPELAATLGRSLGEACAVTGLDARTRIFSSGHAGVIAALAEAVKDLRSRRVPRAIVGGVDSLVEPATVARYHARNRLKVDGRPVGLMPGEAAAFFLVEALAPAEARGAAILATLEAPATAIEPVLIDGDDDLVCDASGLTECARHTLGALADGGARTGLVIGDLNGEPYRSQELAYLVARALEGLQSPWRLWHPADTIGDTGAAAAAVSIAVGARALHRGYARTEGALIFASSDSGLRGTVHLAAHRRAPAKG